MNIWKGFLYMPRLIYHYKKNIFGTDNVQVIPLHLHEGLTVGTKVEFNGKLLDYHNESELLFIENSVVPQLVNAALDLLEFEELDSEDVELLRNLGQKVNCGDILSTVQIKIIECHVKVLSINVEKNGYGGFYINGWVLDPMRRLWQVCPGEYSEGWFRVNDGFEKMGSEYSRLNNIEISSLFR